MAIGQNCRNCLGRLVLKTVPRMQKRVAQCSTMCSGISARHHDGRTSNIRSSCSEQGGARSSLSSSELELTVACG